MSWQLLEDQHPELAAFGAERLNGKVAYLATIRKDGSPGFTPDSYHWARPSVCVYGADLAKRARSPARRTVCDSLFSQRQ